MTTRSREEQFSGIKLWVTILERLYTEIPLARNGTFTGKQSADFLFKILPSIVTHKECSREMAVNLLKLFLRDGYFLNNRNEDNFVFRDNDSTSYRFVTKKIEEYIKDSGFGSKKVRRVSSMKVQGSSYQRSNTSALRKFNGYSDDVDSFCSPRLSLSCGDLTQFSKPEPVPTKPSTSSYFVQNTKKNLKFLCESVLKSSENVKNSSLVSRGMSPLIQRMSTRQSSKQQQQILNATGSKSPTKKTVTAPITKRCAITEADEFKLWTYCLTERFKQAAAGSSLIHEFNGADIRWNCKMISARRIVARLPERIEKFEQNGEFSKCLIDDLRRLSNWSATTIVANNSAQQSSVDDIRARKVRGLFADDKLSSANSNGVKSDERTGAQFASSFRPPLTTQFKARSVSPTVKTFTATITPKKRGGQTEAGQLFSKIAITLVKCKFVPLVREDVAQSLVAIYHRMRRCGDVKVDESVSARNKSTELRVLTNLSTITTKPLAKLSEPLIDSLQSPSRLRKQTQGKDLTDENNNILPVRTSTTEKIAGPSRPTISTATSVQTRLQKRRSMNEPLLSEIATENRQKFISCIQLCLLTLQPPARRKLQVLLRYLDRILRNSTIRLHTDKDNRTYIVERLSALFIEPKGSISEVISANFLALFLDKLQELFFQIPPWLEADVRQKVDNLVSGKELLTTTGSVVSTVCASRRSHEDVYGRRRSHTTNSTPPTAVTKTYCERIDTNTFESQKRQQDESMLKLLDGIVDNENLKPAKRAEMLQSFRATYPRIYEMRFPSQNSQAEISDVFLDDSAVSASLTTRNPVARSQSLMDRFRRMVID